MAETPQIELMDIVGLYEAQFGLQGFPSQIKAEFEKQYLAEANQQAKDSKKGLLIRTKIFFSILETRRSIVREIAHIPYLSDIILHFDSILTNLSDLREVSKELSDYLLVGTQFNPEDDIADEKISRILTPVNDFYEILDELLEILAPHRQEGVKYPSDLEEDLRIFNECVSGLAAKPYTNRTGRFSYQIFGASKKISGTIEDLRDKFAQIYSKIEDVGYGKDFLADLLHEDGYSGKVWMSDNYYWQYKAKFFKRK